MSVTVLNPSPSLVAEKLFKSVSILFAHFGEKYFFLHLLRLKVLFITIYNCQGVLVNAYFHTQIFYIKVFKYVGKYLIKLRTMSATHLVFCRDGFPYWWLQPGLKCSEIPVHLENCTPRRQCIHAACTPNRLWQIWYKIFAWKIYKPNRSNVLLITLYY